MRKTRREIWEQAAERDWGWYWALNGDAAVIDSGEGGRLGVPSFFQQ